MINIKYDRKHTRVTIKGHARSAEQGHDLVCAAVSAVVLTLAVNVKHLQKADVSNHTVIKLAEGDATIRCAPLPKYKLSVEQIFNTVCAGFEVLAEEYPEFISYKVEG